MIPRSEFRQVTRQAGVPERLFSASAAIRMQRSLAAMVLSAGLLLVSSGKLLAQDVPPPPPDASQQQDQSNQQIPQYGAQVPDDGSQQPAAQPEDNGQQAGAPQGQPLGADQLDQLVAPIALYPDSLVAQVLAAATYPTQIVEADRWREAQGNASADQIASGANAQQWDPSVKALTAFPTVLSQMDKNLSWTTDLGNAYYNQPQDVMDAVQRMRQKAQQAGNLQSSPQLAVSDDDGDIAIAPANPDVVYVPVYDPWMVYGPPVVAWPGYYYAPPPGLFIGVGFGYRIGFAWGVPLRPWAPWGWGWHYWGCGWHNRTVIYNRTTYITRSTTVINHGFNRPGAPPAQLAGQRGSFMNRPAYSSYAHNVASGARPVPSAPLTRPGNFNNRAVSQPGHMGQPGYNRPGAPTEGYRGQGNTARPVYTPGQTNNRPPQYRPAPSQNYNYSRPAPQQNYSRPAPQTYSRPAPQQNYSRPAPAPRSAPAPHVSAPAPHGGGGHPR